MTDIASPTFGRIDVHSHLLPGIDDGCKTIDESLHKTATQVASPNGGA